MIKRKLILLISAALVCVLIIATLAGCSGSSAPFITKDDSIDVSKVKTDKISENQFLEIMNTYKAIYDIYDSISDENSHPNITDKVFLGDQKMITEALDESGKVKVRLVAKVDNNKIHYRNVRDDASAINIYYERVDANKAIKYFYGTSEEKNRAFKLTGTPDEITPYYTDSTNYPPYAVLSFALQDITSGFEDISFAKIKLDGNFYVFEDKEFETSIKIAFKNSRIVYVESCFFDNIRLAIDFKDQTVTIPQEALDAEELVE